MTEPADRGYFRTTEIASVLKLTPAAVRWHCRRGALARVAFKIGQDWCVPTREAAAFIAGYRRYAPAASPPEDAAGSPNQSPIRTTDVRE